MSVIARRQQSGTHRSKRCTVESEQADIVDDMET